MSDRQHGIGGSEAAAACGLDPYRSRVQLWLEKTGKAPARDTSEAMHWGTKLEPLLLDELRVRADGYKIGPDSGGPRRSEAWPFMVTEGLDGIAQREAQHGIVECKTAGLYKRDAWADDGCPDAYVIQAHHYLAVTGDSFALLACLIGGQEFVWRRLDRDDGLIASMVQLEEEFWQHVESDTPPAPDGSESADRMVKMLYPHGKGGVVRFGPSDVERVEEVRKLRKALKATETKIAEHEQALKLALGECETGMVDGRPCVRWSSYVQNRVDVTALREARPEIAQEFTKEVQTRRFSIR